MAVQKVKILKVPGGNADGYEIEPASHTHSDNQITYNGYIAGDVTAVDMAVSNLHSANRLAFGKPEGITIEYSRDGGSTWVNYGATDDQKVKLVSGIGNTFVVGGTSANVTTNYQLRITLNAYKMYVYTRAKKLLVNISTNGANNCRMKVEYALLGSQTTFVNINTYAITGWSGWNSIPIDFLLGGGSGQTNNRAVLRLTFTIGSINHDYSNALSISNIAIHGSTYWTCNSEMAKTGHLYQYDSSQNATFPKNVKAISFVEGGTALSSKYLGISAKAADSAKLNGQQASYYLNYNNLTNKPTINSKTADGYVAAGGSNAYKVWKTDANGNPAWRDDANTDTKNTAGTTNKTATKMFLVGATEQTTNPQTYSNTNVYIGTDNCLYSNGTKVLTAHQSLADYATKSWVTDQNYIKNVTAAAGSDINTVGTPSVTVSNSGTTSTLTFHKLKGATGATGPKGDTGPQGPKGETGAAAGFGTPTATVDANVGTPSVTITASGANTAKVFNFAFKNLKGQKGDTGPRGPQGEQGPRGETGATPTITASATVSNTTGTPTVNVTRGGTDAAPTFTFAFTNLKGAKGDPGVNATTTAVATHSANGLMSAEDKKKLDKLKLTIGGGQAVANSATSNGSTYIKLVDFDSVISEHKIVGSGATTVTSDSNGNITINSTNSQYSLVGTNGTTGLIKNGSTVTSASGYTACPIVGGIPYYKNTNTDTKNTAGSTNSNSKLFLIGATSQAANSVTYSNNQIYATNGTLTVNALQATITIQTASLTGTNSLSIGSTSDTSFEVSSGIIDALTSDGTIDLKVGQNGSNARLILDPFDAGVQLSKGNSTISFDGSGNINIYAENNIDFNCENDITFSYQPLVRINNTQQGVVCSPTLTSIQKLTQAQYNALSSKDADTIYVIIG